MSRARQLAFDLPASPALARRDFLVADTNRTAFKAACDSSLGQAGRLVLTGPAGSGKSHLATIWATASGAGVLTAADLEETAVKSLMDGGAAVIEDADRLAGRQFGENLLFHALNLAAAHRTRLLLTGRRPPARWGVIMPDLTSRLAALPHVAIGLPDDALLSSILDKLFSDKQISVSVDAIRFLVPRMGRSFAAAVRIVTELDHRALAEQRPINRNFVRKLYESDPDIITGTGEP